ncbi:hypothetical protein JIP62_12220 [Brevundimonas vitis]|uniref:Uncharacterized protein n=1 Tax=Brevundimonas vitisensis TaxID=2800818 RepID=A0ABX7BKG9_9CAUL|nr:hypothetical protein [Brevundimonas vitisensis]QQQ18068.1 hypothetical protein JIP62_12220 [Brevundimonas vitisensis]
MTDVGLPLSAFKALARFTFKEGAKQAGKGAATTLLWTLIGGENARFDALDEKLDLLVKGQEVLKSQLAELRADVGYRIPLERIHTEIHGLHLAMKREPEARQLKRMISFLEPASRGSARELADDLSQKLFGSGQTTPDGFWNRGEPIHGPKTTGGHIRELSDEMFRRRAVGLKDYVDKLLAAHVDMSGYFGLLATAIIAVNQYLVERGNPFLRQASKEEYAPNSVDNPALLTRPGLAGMATDWLMDGIAHVCPMAFDLYAEIYIGKGSLRLGLTTARKRMLEWDTGADRHPIAVTSGIWASESYRGQKPVFADHGERTRTAPNHWWQMMPAEGAGAPADAVLLRAMDTDKFLGHYSFKSYSHQTKAGRQVKYSDEVGLGGSRTDPKSRWKPYIRRDSSGTVLLVLEHVGQTRCLLVNGLDSNGNRQIHLDQSAADRGDWPDYAFSISF